MSALHLHRFGPDDGVVVLALHGLTGHGKRWGHLAGLLPEVRMLAPDLRGHGRSTSLPPWDFETIVEDLVGLLDAEGAGAVVVVGHSFGGATAIHLAARYPERVRGLVLLDPAIAVDPVRMGDIAQANLDSPDYTDVDEARWDKRGSAWSPDEVAAELLEAELTEHLVPTTGGRVGWRIAQPAITSYWGQLARPFALPPATVPTVLVRAGKVQPPFLTPDFRDALAGRLGANLRDLEWDCDHMVAQARPADTAELVRSVL